MPPLTVWRVYEISNKINEKRYIGVTSQPIPQRWAQHIRNSSNEKTGKYALQVAIQKYGPAAFSVRVMRETTDQEAALSMERQLIEECQTIVPNGYNLVGGGGGSFNPSERARSLMRLAKLGKRLSAEHKKKIGAAHLGRRQSPEHRAKIAAKQRGKRRRKMTPDEIEALRAINTGRPRSEETKKKISQANKGAKRTEDHLAAMAEIRMGKEIRYPTGRSGVKGVWPVGNKWCAQISWNGKPKHLGSFPTIEEAAHAYRVAAAKRATEARNA